MIATSLLQCPNNEPQRSVDDSWPCIREHGITIRQQRPIIELSAASLSNSALNKICAVTGICVSTERQVSVNDCWPCIVDNARVVRLHLSVIKRRPT